MGALPLRRPPLSHAALLLLRLPPVAQHVDPTNEKLHGKNWTEWRLVEQAQPRFPGHMEPNVPLWGYQMARSPAPTRRSPTPASSAN